LGLFPPSATSRHPVQRTCPTVTDPLRSLHTSFAKLKVVPKTKSTVTANDNVPGSEANLGAQCESRCTNTADEGKSWRSTSSAHPIPGPEPRDSGVSSVRSERCRQCRFDNIASCAHRATETSLEPDHRAPIPPAWQCEDWEEERQLRQEIEAWKDAERAFDVPDMSPEECESSSQDQRVSVMARGRPIGKFR
jgi:hypothetical protein